MKRICFYIPHMYIYLLLSFPICINFLLILPSKLNCFFLEKDNCVCACAYTYNHNFYFFTKIAYGKNNLIHCLFHLVIYFGAHFEEAYRDLPCSITFAQYIVGCIMVYSGSSLLLDIWIISIFGSSK